MTWSRRAMLRSSAAGLMGLAGFWGRAQAQDRFDQDALMAFEPTGQITLVHIGELHGQMMPHYSRPAEVNFGVGQADGQAPYLTGEAFRVRFGLGGRTPLDYAHTHEDFVALAMAYGPIGGLDRVATAVNIIRKTRPEALFLTARADTAEAQLADPPSRGSVAPILAAMRPDMMDRDTGVLTRAGVKIALIRTPSRQAHLPWQIEDAQAQGAQVIVCISQLGFDADLALAKDNPEIDVILSCASRTALPEPYQVGTTHIIASGTQTRFVSRVDLKMAEGQVLELEHKLIPMFSDLIASDPEIAGMINAARAPLQADLQEVIGQAEALLYTRGTLGSRWSDVINAALIAHYNADVALSPGVDWGNTILPGQNITREDIYSLGGSAGFRTYRVEMTGAELSARLEADAARRFHPDPRQRGKEEMLRAGGLGFRLDVAGQEGERITDLILLASQSAILPDKTYVVAGWGSAQGNDQGQPLWQILESYIRSHSPLEGAAISAVSLAERK